MYKAIINNTHAEIVFKIFGFPFNQIETFSQQIHTSLMLKNLNLCK